MRNSRRVFQSKNYTVTTPPANLVDRSRFKNNGTFSGGAIYKKVRDVYVMDFTSPTSLVTIPKNTSINDLPQFTFRAWVYYGGAGGGNGGRLFDKGGVTKKALYIDSLTGAITFVHGFSGTGGVWNSPVGGLIAGNYYDVQITYDNSATANNPVITINGVSATVTRTTAPVGTALTDNSSDLYVGNRGSSDRSLNGYLSEVELYAGILSVAEAKRSYNASCRRYGLNPIA